MWIIIISCHIKDKLTTVEIFFDFKEARTRQRYSEGTGKGGLPFRGTGLLCPLTAK